MKLVVGGCSFSSAFGIPQDTHYPALLSKMLDVELDDQARIQGSNYRIWRTIGNKVISGEISPSDIIIIQYTEIHRQEFWSPIPPAVEDTFVEEPYDNGKLFRWKYGADHYARGIEKSFCNTFTRFSNEQFDLERFKLNHYMFCALLNTRGINKVYFVETKYLDKLPPTNFCTVVDCRHMLDQYHLENDPWHMSTQGHRITANLLLNVIQS